MSIASKLVLTVALAGFALPALAQGNVAATPTELQATKPALHQSAPVKPGPVAAISTSKPVAAKAEAGKTEVLKASTTKPVTTTTTAPVTKSN